MKASSCCYLSDRGGHSSVRSAVLAAFVALMLTMTRGSSASPPGADTDGDEIPDSWEVAYGLNLLDAGDALLDPDGDGISNLMEYFLGGNPNVPDRSILPSASRSSDGRSLAISFTHRT